MNEHKTRELVNRLTAVAQKFANTQQLRERIAWEVLPEGYNKPPADYKGRVWIESQVKYLLAAVEQNQLDADRYRWLRDNFSRLVIDTDPIYSVELDRGLSYIKSIRLNGNLMDCDKDSVNAAIDGAMKEHE